MRLTHKGMLSHFAGSSKHKRKWTDKQIKNMRDRRLVGETFESIAKDYGVSKGSIHKAIQRHNPIIKNVTLPKGYIHITRFCEIHNMEYNTVIYHIRKKKLPTVKYNNKIYLHIDTEITNDKFINDNQIDNILKLRDKGLNITSISKQLGLNRATVRYYINSI